LHGQAARPNNSFKPKPLRFSKGTAEKACHAFASTARFGLTQALCAVKRKELFDFFRATVIVYWFGGLVLAECSCSLAKADPHRLPPCLS
jgi:hypothetical protein